MKGRIFSIYSSRGIIYCIIIQLYRKSNDNSRFVFVISKSTCDSVILLLIRALDLFDHSVKI